MADENDLLRRYYANPALHPSPAEVNPWAVEKRYGAELRNPAPRPGDVMAPVAEAISPTMQGYGLGAALGETYTHAREGDWKGAMPHIAELAMAAAPMPGAKRGKLPMDRASRNERATAQGWQPDKVWYHGGNRIDRFLEKGEVDPRRASSGPMPFFTDDPAIASNYATGKPDISRMDEGRVSDYFTVSPKDMGRTRERTPYTVEQTWYALSPEQRATIAERSRRVGYEDLDAYEGPFVLHPEGIDARPSGDHYDWVLKNEARGNHLAALRELWHDSGNLVGEEAKLAEIYKLAGYPYPISQYNAPWTTNPGVFAANLRMQNPLVTTDATVLQGLIPALEQAVKRDRTRRKEFGADDWDKNTRWTPREWVDELKRDVADGKNSYVWTSIPDKITDVLRQAGYDGILDTGGKMGGQGHEVAIPFSPEQVRAAYSAAFDPAKIDSKKFLAGIAGAGAAGLTTADILRQYGDEKEKP